MSHEPQELSPEQKLELLHERVNGMLDMPLPAETDAWPVLLDYSAANVTLSHIRVRDN